jgi:hypothetical protein
LPLPIAVIYNAADGQRFLQERPMARAVMALKPLAAYTVRDVAIPVMDGNLGYADSVQASMMVMRERNRAA